MVCTRTESKVQLEVFELESGDRKYQALAINLIEPWGLIEVSELLSLEIPRELDWQREIILWGSPPNWLYNHLVWRFHDVPWVACFNVPLKAAVVVSSHIPEVERGDIIPINLNQAIGAAILICGAPDSGKSILSHALRKSLRAKKPNASIYLHRANWDGEGNHTLENPDPKLAKMLKEESKRKIHLHPDAKDLVPKYFKYHAEAVEKIREVVDLALVDVGGKAEDVKMPVIEQCSHYIIISKDPDKIQDWHKLCETKLKLLGVIHSVWEEKLEISSTEPYLEIVAGKWKQGAKIPEILLDEICRHVLEVNKV